jgi:hypothetical protein
LHIGARKDGPGRSTLERSFHQAEKERGKTCKYVGTFLRTYGGGHSPKDKA